MSFLQNQAARIYKNHVEYLIETSDCKIKQQEHLGNITSELNSSKKSATLPRFEQGFPTYIK